MGCELANQLHYHFLYQTASLCVEMCALQHTFAEKLIKYYVYLWWVAEHLSPKYLYIYFSLNFHLGLSILIFQIHNRNFLHVRWSVILTSKQNVCSFYYDSSPIRLIEFFVWKFSTAPLLKRWWTDFMCWFWSSVLMFYDRHGTFFAFPQSVHSEDDKICARSFVWIGSSSDFWLTFAEEPAIRTLQKQAFGCA